MHSQNKFNVIKYTTWLLTNGSCSSQWGEWIEAIHKDGCREEEKGYLPVRLLRRSLWESPWIVKYEVSHSARMTHGVGTG